MAIDDSTNYTLTGAQVKDLAQRIKSGGGGGSNAVILYSSVSFHTPIQLVDIYSDAALTTSVTGATVKGYIEAGKTVAIIYETSVSDVPQNETLIITSCDNHSEATRGAIVFTGTFFDYTNSEPVLYTLACDQPSNLWSASQKSIPTNTSELTNDGDDGIHVFLATDDVATVATTGAYSDLTGTPSTFTGATSSVAGSTGLVPAPAAGDQSKVLTGGGSWTNILNMVYPVGAIYLSTNSTSPSTLFGGTWAQIKDKFILAAGSTYSAGTTGGSATINLSHSHTVNSHNHSLPANTGSHTLTTSEMPSHSHDTITMSGQTLYTANSTATYVGGHSAVRANYSDGSWERKMGTNSTGGGGGHSHTIGGNTGDKSPGTNSQLSSTQSIIPPYLAVYVWKRTA